jgi:hypothetical protein
LRRTLERKLLLTNEYTLAEGRERPNRWAAHHIFTANRRIQNGS